MFGFFFLDYIFHFIHYLLALARIASVFRNGLGWGALTHPPPSYDMLHVSQCNFVGGTDGVSGSNRLPNCSSAGLTGELSIICHQNEHNEKRTGMNSPRWQSSTKKSQCRKGSLLRYSERFGRPNICLIFFSQR